MYDIPEAISSVSSLMNGVLDRLWPNPSEVEKAKIASLKMEIDRELEIIKTQTNTNNIEASHTSIFVAGWRPFVGWVCGLGFMYAVLIEPMSTFVAKVVFGYSGIFPVINTDLTLQILGGMLGLSAVRGYEKSKGVSRNSMEE